MKAKDEKTLKTIAGIGALGIAAYLAYTQLYGSEDTSIGGSGNFSGLGGGEGVTDEGILSGTTDSGINYNINLPQVDTSGISALISQPVTSGGSGSSVITGAGEVPAVTSKKAAVSSGDSTKSETSGSLSSSLAQVFGTPAQQTNERGDYYTTAAGGGAGAVKGLSLGEMAINLLTGKTASGQTVKSEPLPTGASTASNPKYDLTGVDVKSILAADTAKKEQMQAAIDQTKIGAPKTTNTSDVLNYLKSGGTLTNETTGATITGKTSSTSSPSSTTTKKAATTTYKEGGQTKYKDASGKVHIVAKK